MISKEQFVKVINELQEVDDLKKEINNKIHNLKFFNTDFLYSDIFIFNHSNTVIKLLANTFSEEVDKIKIIKEIVEWWIYDTDYGREDKYTRVTYDDGTEVIIDTPEKLYDDILNSL